MSSSDPLLNRVFDRRYLVRRKLGSGGMADVYLADDQELGRQVALKMLNERHATDEQVVERFRLEAQNAAGLNHPNIVSVFDRGQAEGTYYIAMEFLDGRTLKDLLIRNGPTPIPVAIDYARQMLGALAFAHRNGIVHRDIKPHNIVVGGDGRLKVTDFGIARSGTSQLTEAGSIVGTAQYLSPEQARGAPVDPRSDLYSLGIVMYEMLTGTVPFTGDAPVEIAMKHLSSIPDPPSQLRPEVSHDLDAVVMRALAKEPDQRYASADEMEADLARVARGAAVSPRTEEAMTQVLSGGGVASAPTVVSRPRATAPAPAPPAYRPPGGYYDEPTRRRSPWPWLLGLLAVAIAAAAGYLLYQKIQNQLNQAKTIAVVDVGLLRQNLATQKLVAEGLQVSIKKEASDAVPKGAVVSQEPVAGLKVARDSIVTLNISTGKRRINVPAVKGFTLAQAVSTLADAALKANPVSIYSTAPANSVTAQDPRAGKSVVTGTTVRINISKGLKPIPLTNLVGQTFATASSQLQKAGFIVSRSDIDSQKPTGQVVAQDPVSGTQVPAGTKITLSVSRGQAQTQIPDVTGQNDIDAETLLSGAGFSSEVQTQPVTDPSQDGVVLSQNPVGGTQAAKGTVIILTVGSYSPAATPPAPTPPPTTTAATTTVATTTTATTTATAATTTTTP